MKIDMHVHTDKFKRDKPFLMVDRFLSKDISACAAADHLKHQNIQREISSFIGGYLERK